MKTKIVTLAKLLLLTISISAQQREATDFAVKNPDKTFVGAVLEYKSINDDAHRFVNITVPEAITISFSIPVKPQTIMPSYENMMKVVRETVIASGKIKSQQSFSYQLKEIKSYQELSWYFGQTVNLETFFGIPLNTKPSRTAAVVDITQKFFSMEMDFPDDGELYDQDSEVCKRADELVYVGSLSFGRKATMLIETETPYIDLKQAIEESLSSNGKPISAKSQSILLNSDIRVMVLSNPKLPDFNPDNPFTSVMAYFQKPVTIDDFGAPLQFSATYIKDNSMFSNKY